MICTSLFMFGSMYCMFRLNTTFGWIVLYDREWKTLAKLDPGLEHLELLERYLAAYGVRM